MGKGYICSNVNRTYKTTEQETRRTKQEINGSTTTSSSKIRTNV